MKFSDNDKYPDEIRTFISEGVREEKNKKLTIIGLFAGDDIIVDGEEEGVMLQSLSILTIFKGGDGTVNLSAKLYDPDGGIIDKLKSDTVLNPNANLVMTKEYSPFLAKKFGEYIFEVKFDDDEDVIYQYKFNVRGASKKNE